MVSTAGIDKEMIGLAFKYQHMVNHRKHSCSDILDDLFANDPEWEGETVHADCEVADDDFCGGRFKYSEDRGEYQFELKAVVDQKNRPRLRYAITRIG